MGQLSIPGCRIDLLRHSLPEESPVTTSAEERPQVSIVVPTYGEAENLPELVERVASAMRETERCWRLTVVDDDSRDGTPEVMDGLAAAGHPVRLITRTEERGLSSAVLRGFREAEGDLLVCMDADLSHPPEALPRLLDCLEETDAEFAIGSRYVEGAGTDEDWGVRRWLNSKVATLLARPFTAARDPMAGFFAMPRAVFERAEQLNPVGYKIGLELMVKCGVSRVGEVPIHFADRKRGESKLTLKEQLNYLTHLKRLADYKFGGFSQFMQFCCVGGSGALVDLSVLTLLLGTGVQFYLGRAAAIMVAMTWNFFLNRWITFSTSRSRSLLGQYGRFVASCGVGAIINWSVSVGLLRVVPQFPLNTIACAAAGIAAGMLFNFTLSRYWVFRKRAVGAAGDADGAPAADGRA
jgi:dolichol-phosphate mannosyltransferase